MSEHKVWAVVDGEGELATVVVNQPTDSYLRDGLRVVPAMLVIPEPQWRVAIYDGGAGGYLVVPHGPNDYGPKPYIIVRAPDAVTALQRAIEKAGKS